MTTANEKRDQDFLSLFGELFDYLTEFYLRWKKMQEGLKEDCSLEKFIYVLGLTMPGYINVLSMSNADIDVTKLIRLYVKGTLDYSESIVDVDGPPEGTTLQ